MFGRVTRWLMFAGIVTAPTGCDNVSWGGFEMGLRGPGADAVEVQADTAREVLGPPPVDLALGPILYAGVRTGNRASLVPVGEITPEGLRPIPETLEGGDTAPLLLASRLRVGTEMALYHHGVRVGTLVVDENGIAEGPYCGMRPHGDGVLQLVPDASQAGVFLALEAGERPEIGFDTYQELRSVYDQRVASLNLGAEAIPLVGAAWPPSLLETRQALQVFQLPGGEAPVVLATFLYQDQLRVGPAPAGAYSLMVLGEPVGSDFDLTYTWYRPVERDGKGAPRLFSRMDWDGDGAEEILLEIIGADTRWFAALDRGPAAWLLTFQDPCGTPGDAG